MSNSDLARVEELVAEWKRLNDAGQFVPAEELCSECPELLEEVAQRIDVLDPQLGEETAAGDEIGMAATMVETGRGDSDEIGALGILQTYRELRFHARGGLGEIYIADDTDLKREVVLKFIRGQHRNRRDANDQFRLEAEVTARLDHPGVVPVHGFGKTPDGRYCYAMKFIKGDTLESKVAEIHLPAKRGEDSIFDSSRSVELRQLIAKFITVCQTLAYAHNRGILHRDIKPDNIMLGRFGETLVVDWGLALAVNRDDTARASGEETLMPTGSGGGSSSGSTGGAVGTPAYMSPEQAAGLPVLTPGVDVFSLGATLYKILVGRAPYRGDSARETLKLAQAGAWVPARELNSEIPAGLDAICSKALAVKLYDRYATALDMADDLEHWLADEPLEAMPENRLQTISRWTRKNRGKTQWIVTAVLLTIVGLAVGVTSSVVKDQELVQQRVTFLEAQGNFNEILVKSAFDDLRNDVRLLAGRPTVTQAAIAFDGDPGTRSPEDKEKILELEQSLADLFREFLAQNPSYMQVRYIANDTEGHEKVRLDRRKQRGSSIPIDKDQLQGKRGNEYFDETVLYSPGRVYLSDININKENGKRQWDFPVVRAAVPVLAPDGSHCLGIVVINMHFGYVLEKMKQAATDDLQVYLTDREGRFLAFPDHPDIAFCSYRGLNFNLEMLFEDVRSFRKRQKKSISELRATPTDTLLISGKDRASTADLLAALEKSIPGETFGKLEVLKTEYDENDAFDPADSDPSGNDARPMVILHGVGLSAASLQSLLKEKLSARYDVARLPALDASTDHALYCRKIFLDDRTGGSDRFLCLLLVLPHSTSMDATEE
jgi:serine/threonine protein kinase